MCLYHPDYHIWLCMSRHIRKRVDSRLIDATFYGAYAQKVAVEHMIGKAYQSIKKQ